MEEEKQQFYQNISSEIVCVFKTNLADKYKIEESQQYTVKTEFNEKNLSELIQHILTEENPELLDDTDEPFKNIRFEFLINGEFLRGNIKSHLLKHKITAEKDIAIYYTFGINKPEEEKKVKEEDWISSLSLVNPFQSGKQSPFVASLFNGDLAFYDENINLLCRENISDMPIKQSVVTPYKQQNNKHLVVSACQDNSIQIGQYTHNSKKKEYSYQGLAECHGNDASVNCLDVNPLLPTQFCSGSYDGKLNLYNISDRDLNNADSQFQTLSNGKKVKLDKKSIEPVQTHEIHSESITNCQFKTQHQIYTASLDHSIKLYDIQKVAMLQQIGTKDSAVTTFASKQDIVISGHEDSYIKTFDFREGNKGPQKIFKSHSLWVSDIQTLPDNEYLFISASYDHSIKLWDLRSQFPVFTLKSHHDKIFSVCWNGDSKILSGGSDQQIASHVFTINKV